MRVIKDTYDNYTQKNKHVNLAQIFMLSVVPKISMSTFMLYALPCCTDMCAVCNHAKLAHILLMYSILN